MSFLPAQYDRRYFLTMTLVWLAVVSAAYSYCHMHSWVYEYAEEVPNAADIWLLSRWMFWPFILPVAFVVLAYMSGREHAVAGLVLSALVAVFLGAVHANIVNNVMGIEESFWGTFYYMVPITLGTYTLYIATSLIYVRRYASGGTSLPREEQMLMVNKGRTIVRLKASEVDWMQSARNYIDVHAGGQAYILRNTLSKMEETLEGDRFVRIHRSYIVNRNAIDSLSKNRDGSATIKLKDGTELPCGRAHRDALSSSFSTAS